MPCLYNPQAPPTLGGPFYARQAPLPPSFSLPPRCAPPSPPSPAVHRSSCFCSVPCPYPPPCPTHSPPTDPGGQGHVPCQPRLPVRPGLCRGHGGRPRARAPWHREVRGQCGSMCALGRVCLIVCPVFCVLVWLVCACMHAFIYVHMHPCL